MLNAKDVPMTKETFSTDTIYVGLRVRPPSQWSVAKSVTKVQQELARKRKVTDEYIPLSTRYKVPKAAKINPFGIRLLGAERQANVSVVAIHLTTYLNECSLLNRVKKTNAEIASELNLSERTVAEVMRTLKKMGMILELSRSHYFLSPKLAWYGNEVVWAILIERSKTQSLQEVYEHFIKHYTDYNLQTEDAPEDDFDDLCL